MAKRYESKQELWINKKNLQTCHVFSTQGYFISRKSRGRLSLKIESKNVYQIETCTGQCYTLKLLVKICKLNYKRQIINSAFFSLFIHFRLVTSDLLQPTITSNLRRISPAELWGPFYIESRFCLMLYKIATTFWLSKDRLKRKLRPKMVSWHARNQI